jgi:hypothetical protein
MKKITKYRANDGSEWDTYKDALVREHMIDFVDSAMAKLKTTPGDSNWEGYVQHDKNTIFQCKKELFEIANQEGVLKWWIDSQINEHGKTVNELIEACHPSWFGRMLDGGHAPLSVAYRRLMCIDDLYREWNQPYYAINPGSGKEECVG